MGQDSPLLLALIAATSFVLAYIGASVGLVLGHLRLPLLMWYLGSGPTGPAANGLISGAGALAGAVRHLREGNVSWSCLGLMGVPSVVGALLASYVFTRHISPLWAQSVIGFVLALTGLTMILAGKNPEKVPERRPNIPLEIAIGLTLGALSSITGLMLGSLRLPMMIRVLNIDPKVAVGSNMAIGCITALVGALATLLSNRLPWSGLGWVLLAVVPPTMLGGWLGVWLTARISKNALQKFAGWIVGLTGVQMIAFALFDAGTDDNPDWPDFFEETSSDDWDDWDDD